MAIQPGLASIDVGTSLDSFSATVLPHDCAPLGRPRLHGGASSFFSLSHQAYGNSCPATIWPFSQPATLDRRPLPQEEQIF
jgi:hypothetical protein